MLSALASSSQEHRTCSATSQPLPVLTPHVVRMQGQDLRTGNLTAPAVYALQSPVGPELERLIRSQFVRSEDLSHAIHLIKHSGGIDAARQLARSEADQVGSLRVLWCVLVSALHFALCAGALDALHDDIVVHPWLLTSV